MLLFLLKFSACLSIFLIFYKLLLEKESIHTFKRFYLLAALLLSIIIPLITFTEYVEPELVLGSFQPLVFGMDVPPQEVMQEEPTNYLPIVLWSIYAMGVLLFGLKFSLNLFQIVSRIKKNPKYKSNIYTRVLLLDSIAPHTFFNYIFLNKNKFETRQIPKEVILHEETHAKQKHSLDILLIEFLQIMFWFNPLIYSSKKAIRLNHEFLADEAVLNQGTDSSTYQQILLAFSSNASQTALANAINYSLIKKRFTIMKSKSSKKAIWLRSLLLLPLLGGLLFSFSNTKEVEKVTEPLMETSTLQRTPSKGVTESLMNEYRAFMEEYKTKNRINGGKYKRIVAIYNLMSDSQKASVDKYPKVPGLNLNEVKAKKPTKNQYESWKDASTYAIWIDGKNVDNKELNNYSFTDIVHFIGSFVHLNARSDKFSQPYQFRLYTEKGFENTYRKVKTKSAMDEVKEELELANSIGGNDTEYRKTIPVVNGIKCDDCTLFLSKKGIEGLILSTTTGNAVTKFKIKFPGKPTESITGNTLIGNEKVRRNLESAAIGQNIQLFMIKTKDETLTPVMIELVDKNNKKHSNSPKVVKGDSSSLPPPPPPPSAPKPNSPATFEEYIKTMGKNGDVIYYEGKKITAKQAITLYKKYGKLDMLTQKIAGGKYIVKLSQSKGTTSTVKNVDFSKNPPPPPPPAPIAKVVKGKKSDLPPPPPPPKPPLDYVIDMAKKGATFIYNGKKITSDKAIELLKNNRKLNISSKTNKGKTTIEISKTPITIKGK